MATFAPTDTYTGLVTDFDFSTALLNSLTLGSTSATSFTLTDPTPANGDYQFVFTGTGLTYNSEFANAGTITAVEVRVWNGSAFVTTANWNGFGDDGFGLDAATAMNSDVALLNAFFGGDDLMNGANSFADSLYGHEGDDTLYGHGGADTLRGLEDDDAMYGGGGDDTIFAEFGVDQAYGQAGDDAIYATNSNVGAIYDGGDGGEFNGDTLRAWGISADGTIVDLRTSSVENFEHIALSPAQLGTPKWSVTLTLKGAQASEFHATQTSVTGHSLSNDTFNVFDISGTLNLSGWTFFDWGTGSTTDSVRLAGDTGANTIYAPNVATTLTGGNGADTLYGSDYADNFDGFGGADGADNMYGGDGNDNYSIADAGDVIHEIDGEGSSDRAAVAVNNYILAANVENMELYGVAATAWGNASVNGIVGNALNNVLYGLGGNDVIYSGLGNDTLYGGAGADELAGEDGTDTASYLTSTLGVTVNLTTGVHTGGDAAGDTLIDIENLGGSNLKDTLTGSAGVNTLTGFGGADVLKGMDGADTLIGGVGKDNLTGGAGADKFILNAAAVATNADKIIDFTHNSDTIQLENSVFTKLGAAALNLGGAKFYVGANAHDRSDRVIYDDATGKLYYDADGNKSGAKVLIATLDDGLNLTAGDFQVI